MKTAYDSILLTIKNHQLPGIPSEEGLIHPHYGGYSIANLPASICGWQGLPAPIDNPFSPVILKLFNRSYQHIIFLLVDGLRLELFNRFYIETLETGMHKAWKSLLQEGEFFPLTSISPSTTSAALTTFWTGRLPAEHGVIGYELFLKELGLTANMIFHSVASFIGDTGSVYRAGFNPATFLPVETLGPLFKENGIRSFAFQHSSIASSGLSQMLLKDVQSIPFETAFDLWQSMEKNLTSHRKSRTFSYIYWSGLDTLSHHISPDSSRLYEEWGLFAKLLNQSLNKVRLSGLENTLFIMTADHGQIPTKIEADYDLQNHPDFTRHLVLMPTGEGRLPFLFIKNRQEEEIAGYLRTHWEEQFSMLPSEEILSSGLLGNGMPHQLTIDRMGSHVVFPKGNAYWWWVNKENHLLGRHGGLSSQEMLVPFFALQF